jgi:hypothetical protein
MGLCSSNNKPKRNAVVPFTPDPVVPCVLDHKDETQLPFNVRPFTAITWSGYYDKNKRWIGETPLTPEERKHYDVPYVVCDPQLCNPDSCLRPNCSYCARPPEFFLDALRPCYAVDHAREDWCKFCRSPTDKWTVTWGEEHYRIFLKSDGSRITDCKYGR